MTLPEFVLLSAGSLFSIINPLAAVPAFLAMTPEDSPEARLKMAWRACLTCAGVLAVFSALGQLIFKFIGVTLPSLQIAGGLILLLVSLDSLRGRRSGMQETAEEMEEGVAKADISITPLAIPMLSGPGAISTIIVLSSRARSLPQHASLYLVIIAVSWASYAVFYAAVTGARRINTLLMNIVTRLMGLLLAATAVEFILGGLKAAGVGAG
jgi:multiple antibiotic resistance protein